MTSRVRIKNEEKKAKRKNSVENKKKTETKQRKERYKETENSVAGSRTQFICTFKQLLDHCTTVTLMI